MKPDTWDDIRVGGKKIKDQTGIPVGVGLSAELDTAMAMRAIMYSYGAHEQDAEGNLTIKSPQTLEAIKFVAALFKEAETPEVLAWDPPRTTDRCSRGAHRSCSMRSRSPAPARTTSCRSTRRSPSLRPRKGPVRRMGLEHVMDCYVIWKFSENIQGAQKFLVDYIDNFKNAFLASQFYNFPCFASTVPDLTQIISNDPKAKPPDKYAVLTDVLDWATNVGYPGYSNAAIDETFNTWVINTMFAEAGDRCRNARERSGAGRKPR